MTERKPDSTRVDKNPEYVNLTIDTGDGQINERLPIRSVYIHGGVGDGGERLPDASERIPKRVTGETLGEYMASIGVALDIDVPDRLSNSKDTRMVTRLEFTNVKDFRPERVLAQLPGGAKLLETRAKLVDLRGRLGRVSVRREAEQFIDQHVTRVLTAADEAASPEDRPLESAS